MAIGIIKKIYENDTQIIADIPGGGGGGGAVDSVFGRTGTVVSANGDYNAGQIINTPAGNIASVTVQGALNELDTEKVAGNTAITGATKTKITYDSKGLVTSGTDATTADIADSTNKRYVTDAQLVVIGNTSNTNTGDETITTLGAKINGATEKTTPVDADMVGLMDSASANILKKLSWANIKATLKTYFDSLTTTLTNKTLALGSNTISGTKSEFNTSCTDGNFLYTGDIVGGDATNNIGYLNIPQNSQSNAYIVVLGDAGKHIYHPSADTTARTWTIDSNANVPYPLGTSITFINDTSAGVITIAITSDTLVLAGTGTTGSRTLASNGVATAIKVTSTRWIINGTGLT